MAKHCHRLPSFEPVLAAVIYLEFAFFKYSCRMKFQIMQIEALATSDCNCRLLSCWYIVTYLHSTEILCWDLSAFSIPCVDMNEIHYFISCFFIGCTKLCNSATQRSIILFLSSDLVDIFFGQLNLLSQFIIL